MEDCWVKAHLRTIEDRLAYLDKTYVNMRAWTYNKLIKTYYNDFYGVGIPDYFMELESADNVARIFRLKFKVKETEIEKVYRRTINKV